MSEPTKKQPKGAPDLPDETKELLDDQGDISEQKHGEPENLPEVREAGIAEQDEQGDEDEKTSDDQPEKLDKKHRIRRFFTSFWRHKKWTLPLTLLVVLAVLLAIPATRYPILGSFLSNTYSVEVVDSKNGTPVSGATIAIGDTSVLTDTNGHAKIKAPLGKHNMAISKKYYASSSSHILVGLKKQASAERVKLVATGRQVPMKVIDKLSGKPVKSAEIKVLDTSAKTDESGQAIIVLPTTHVTEKATVTVAGYNQASTAVHITDKVVAGNTISLVPAGRVYFLSNKSGNVDVVSTNFDGTARATITAGIGNEDASTRLFVSPDRKHLALYAKRDDSKSAKLYVIDTNSKQVTQMDSELSTFEPIGWVGGDFVYESTSLTLHEWQPRRGALKSFDAAAGRAVTLGQTDAKGKQSAFVRQEFSFIKILGDRVIYGLSWTKGGYNSYSYTTVDLSKQSNAVISMAADGSDKRTLKSMSLTKNDGYTYMYAVQPSPQTLYIQNVTDAASVFYIYQDGNVTQTNAVNEDSFFKQRPLYLVSPNSKRTFWTETRDGKDVVFVGDANAENSKQVAILDDFAAYGWNTDGYLLVSKDSSQLYILPVSGLQDGRQPMKVSDYYAPSMRGF